MTQAQRTELEALILRMNVHECDALIAFIRALSEMKHMRLLPALRVELAEVASKIQVPTHLFALIAAARELAPRRMEEGT